MLGPCFTATTFTPGFRFAPALVAPQAFDRPRNSRPVALNCWQHSGLGPAPAHTARSERSDLRGSDPRRSSHSICTSCWRAPTDRPGSPVDPYHSLLEQLPLELGEPHVANGLRQMMVLQHATHTAGLRSPAPTGFRQPGRHLMQLLLSLILICRWSLASFFTAFFRSCRPSAAGSPRCSRLSFFRRRLRWRGLGMTSPSERVARLLIPRSIPTTGPVFSARPAPPPPAPITPVSRLLAHRGRQDLDPCGGQILPFFEARRPSRGSTIAFSDTTILPVSRKLPIPSFRVLNWAYPSSPFHFPCFFRAQRRKNCWTPHPGSTAFLGRTSGDADTSRGPPSS